AADQRQSFGLAMAEAIPTERYPWYDVVEGAHLEQGDILLDCPIINPTFSAVEAQGPQEVKVSHQNAIILSQTCDLVSRADGKCNVEQVVLCPIYSRAELQGDKTYSKPE